MKNISKINCLKNLKNPKRLEWCIKGGQATAIWSKEHHEEKKKQIESIVKWSKENPENYKLVRFKAAKNAGLSTKKHRDEDLEFDKTYKENISKGIKKYIENNKEEVAIRCKFNEIKSQKILSKNGNRFNIGQWCVNNPEKAVNAIPNFKNKNNILYYFDKNINDYVPWSDFKKKFKSSNENIIFIDKIKNLYQNSFIQLTYRTQESENWTGAKSAFEQDLIDKNISWFAYIKFYIDKNGVKKPLVVGKTGSLLVNNNGTDLSFSIDIIDGPARRFLYENLLEWNKTQILIIPVETEQEAFDLEKEIQIKYNLFGS